MRDLRHDNLNSFIGACVDPGKICILSNYCTRGSLRLEFYDLKKLDYNDHGYNEFSVIPNMVIKIMLKANK